MRIIPGCIKKVPLLDSFQSGDQARGNRPGGGGARGSHGLDALRFLVLILFGVI